MTQPTIAELKRIDEADAYTRAALEFIWAFTEWWERVEEDVNGRVDIDTDRGHEMEAAYDHWANTR